jgi:hypothetical protein
MRDQASCFGCTSLLIAAAACNAQAFEPQPPATRKQALARLTRNPTDVGPLILRGNISILGGKEGLLKSKAVNEVDAKRRREQARRLRGGRSEDALGPSGRSALLLLLTPLTAFRPLSAAPASLTARGARGLGGRGGGKRLVPYPRAPAIAERRGNGVGVCVSCVCVVRVHVAVNTWGTLVQMDSLGFRV